MLTEVKVNIALALFQYVLRHSHKEVTLRSEQLINIAPSPVVSARACVSCLVTTAGNGAQQRGDHVRGIRVL